MIWMFAVDGTTENPGAKMYPAIICEVCDEPIHEHGLAAWNVTITKDGSRRWAVMFLHKGECIRASEAKSGKLYTSELGVTLSQVTHNFEHPFAGHDLAEWERARPSIQ